MIMAQLLGARRWIGAVAAGGALILSATPTAAGPSTHMTAHRLDIGGEAGAEGVDVTFFISTTADGTAGADVSVWLAPDSPIFDPPTLVGGEAHLRIGPEDSTLSGEIQLTWNASGSPAGTAAVDVVTAPNGAPETISDRQGGNHRLVTEQVVQPLWVTGELTVPGRAGSLTLPIDGPIGQVSDTTLFANSPSSTVNWLRRVGMLQWWYLDGLTVGILAESDKAISWLEVAVILPDGTVLHGSDEDALFDHRGIEADLVLTPNNPGLQPTGGSASVRGDVHRAERERIDTSDGDDRTTLTLQHYRATGTLSLTLDDGTVFGIDLSQGSGPFYGAVERAFDGGAEG